MIRLLFPLVYLTLTTWVSLALLRSLFPAAWSRWVWRSARWAIGIGVVGAGMWVSGRAFDVTAVRTIGMAVSSLYVVCATLLFVTAPVWSGPLLLVRARDAWAARRTPPLVAVDESRRRFLRRAMGTVPATAVVAGPVGAGASLRLPVLNEVDIPVRGLDPRLDGLKILQLTDIHLGSFIDVDQVEAAIHVARPREPDVVVLTGDVSDDYSKLPAALDVVADLDAPLGAWACIGNHEIYRGREEAEAIYAASRVKLLCDEGVVLEKDGASLYLCGADDPARLGREHRPFLEESVARALEGRPSDEMCSVVLSHRPEGFEAAARRNATLTLSGHTHGGQVALLGQSVFEPLLPKSYLLGHYQAGESHLFTSAGLGHWLPFRLNCPCEAALITLRAT